MAAFLPVGNDAGVKNGVTIQALLSGLADGSIFAKGGSNAQTNENR
jgi:hypothetical protein